MLKVIALYINGQVNSAETNFTVLGEAVALMQIIDISPSPEEQLDCQLSYNLLAESSEYSLMDYSVEPIGK